VEQVFKPWPGGRPTNGPTEATLRLVKKNNVKAADVAEVTLHLSRAAAAIHYSKPFIPGDYPTMSALWNFRFAVANTIYRGNSVDANFMPEKVLEPGLQEMIKKINLGDLEVPTGSEVEVKMKDGRVFKEYIDQVTGEPYLPMPREQFIGKFIEQVEFSGLVSKKNAEKIIDMCDNLEKVDDIRKITEVAGKKS
jgi:2-methylcitrate dehydratase PrpD